MRFRAIRTIFLITFAVLLPGLASAQETPGQDWPRTLTIGTASPGGTYHSYGEGLARILTRDLGLPVPVRATQGPGENITLLGTGEIQIAFVTLGAAQQAWNAPGPYGDQPSRIMRALFPMYDTAFHFVVPDEFGIRSVGDLSGKRIGVGPRQGTGGTYMPPVFKTLKIDPVLTYGDWADLTGQFEQHQLDALAVTSGVPFPAFLELEHKTRLRYLSLAPRQIRDLRLAIPELSVSSIPAGAYASLPTNLPTVGLYNFAVVRSDLPEDLAYAIVNAVFSRHEEMVRAHPAATATIPANFIHNGFLPFHDGATRWYRDASDVIMGD
jgi:TRAP transporter TAXI family solute receptor